MVVTESHAFGNATFNLALGAVAWVCLLPVFFVVKSPEISVSQSRRSCENGGVGIAKVLLLILSLSDGFCSG
jgi:hypothetical protein